jgi:hypothetical protein
MLLTGTFFVLAYACKTRTVPLVISEIPDKKINSAAELLHHMESTPHTYSNLNIRFSAKIKTKKNGENALRGKLKIGRDSVIWLSAIPMGIEVARIIADKNGVGMISYLDKKYFQGKYDDFTALAGYPLNLGMLQSALTGSPYFVESSALYRLENDRKNGHFFSPYTKEEFEKLVDGKNVPGMQADMVQGLWFGEGNLLLAKNVIYDITQKRLLEIEYAGYTLQGNDYIPSHIKAKIKTTDETALFTIEYLKTEVNAGETDYPFTIPSGFTPMEIKNRP